MRARNRSTERSAGSRSAENGMLDGGATGADRFGSAPEAGSAGAVSTGRGAGADEFGSAPRSGSVDEERKMLAEMQRPA